MIRSEGRDMTDTPPPPQPRFPYVTAVVAGLVLFLFVGLVILVYRSPNYLGGVVAEPKTDPVTKLNEVRARNQAVLNGTDQSARVSVDESTNAVLAHAAKTKTEKNPYGRLPFPAEPKPVTPEKKEQP